MSHRSLVLMGDEEGHGEGANRFWTSKQRLWSLRLDVNAPPYYIWVWPRAAGGLQTDALAGVCGGAFRAGLAALSWGVFVTAHCVRVLYPLAVCTPFLQRISVVMLGECRVSVGGTEQTWH